LELQRQLPGQLCYFVAGAAVYYYFQHLRRHALLLTITSVAASNLQDWRPWAAVQPLALGTLVAFAACIVPSLGDFGRYGAYGIYIVHFPILQGLIAYGIFENATWAALLAVIALVMKAAVLLWHTIEKPFLRRLSHHVATNRG
jgi:peptidoglycan/LPS O-acetylase OafA/YrhL